jgi:hypothetical protein
VEGCVRITVSTVYNDRLNDEAVFTVRARDLSHVYFAVGPISIFMHRLDCEVNCSTRSDAMVWNELKLHAITCPHSLVLRDGRNLHL